MKLRCTTDSIRLRLRRSETEELQRAGQVADSVDFGLGQVFRFVLKLDAELDQIRAQHEAGVLLVSLPEALGREWAASTTVGLEATQANGAGKSLQLLVEKDFPCLTRSDENKNDFFGELQSDDSLAC